MFAIKLRNLFVIIFITTLLEVCLCDSNETHTVQAFSDGSNAYRFLGDNPLKGHTPARKNRTSKATEVLEEESEIRYTDASNCTISIDPETKAMFTERILNEQYNFVRLRLKGVIISAVGRTIMPDHWIWTYKGTNGGHQLLTLPQQSNYMSFGLAFSNAMHELFNVKIIPKGDCKPLNVGDERTNVQIGAVLAEMTKDLANKHLRYNNSYWCYTRNVPNEQCALFYVCKNYVCPFQFTEYTCCRYSVSEGKENRHIICGNDSYKFNTVWWIFPFVAGHTCFAFFPILLSYIGSKLHNEERDYCYSTQDGYIELDPAVYISVDVSHPVTVLSTILEFFTTIGKSCKTVCSNFCSRCPRVLILWIPCLPTAVHIVVRLWYTHEYQGGLFAHQCVVGNFDSVLAGHTYARRCFLPILGGPYVAVLLFLFFGHILILTPKNIASCLVEGICNPPNFKFAFLPTMSIVENMTGISVSLCTGYKKLYCHTLAQSYLVLNCNFWCRVKNLFCKRFIMHDTPKCIKCFKSVGIFVVCVFELIWTFLYLTFPVVRWFFIAQKAYIIATKDLIKNRKSNGCTRSVLICLSCSLVVLALSFVWYIYCLVFLDGFWFISKTFMFIYVGVIANPSVSNGWVVFVFTSLYYLVDCVNEYGYRYKELLQISIDACEKHQSQTSTQSGLCQDNERIEKELFELIIEKHMPKRVCMCFTMFKFILIACVIGISVHLLVSFDQLGNINETINVFTAVFVSSIPKLVEILFLKNGRKVAQRRLKCQVYKTVCKYRRENADESIHADMIQTV